jgi:hypothetical protein
MYQMSQYVSAASGGGLEHIAQSAQYSSSSTTTTITSTITTTATTSSRMYASAVSSSSTSLSSSLSSLTSLSSSTSSYFKSTSQNDYSQVSMRNKGNKVVGYSLPSSSMFSSSSSSLMSSSTMFLNSYSSNFSNNYSAPNNFFSSFSSMLSNPYNSQLANQSSNYISFTPKPEYHFIADNFLKPGKEGKFVGKAEEIRDHIEDVFEKMFNQPFPNDIKVSVLDDEQFSKLTQSGGVIGLSINRRKQGLLSEIFIKNDFLARVMLTIGHELGHVLTPTLDISRNEEAKAYAFSLMWMKTIKENDVAGLSEAIVTERPANNGLHDVAFFYVDKLLKQGKDICEIYEKIVKGIFSTTSQQKTI